jgi:hypothetical protein
MNPGSQSLRGVRACLWAGPLLSVLFFIGLIPLMGFVPPMHPTDSAATVARIYIDDTDSIRVGTWFLMVGVGLIAPWGVGIAVLTRRIPGVSPVYTSLQLVCIAIGVMIGIGFPLCWAVASYRPGDVDPDIVRMLTDFGWFFFLFDWPPFCIWFVAVALAIFSDSSEDPLFPRWTAYLSIWVCLLSVPAGLMLFFKTGAFAYNGLIAMYVPLAVFFIWVVVMTWAGLRALRALGAQSAPRAATSQLQETGPSEVRA